MKGILDKIANHLEERRSDGLDYITNPVFWVTGIFFVSFAQLLASLSFFFYPDVYSVSPTYTWLSGVMDQETWGLFGIIVSVGNFIFIRRRIVALFFPLTILYWSLLSYGSLISVGGVTPGGTLTLSIAILAALAYISAGGFKMLSYRGSKKYGYYTKEGNDN